MYEEACSLVKNIKTTAKIYEQPQGLNLTQEESDNNLNSLRDQRIDDRENRKQIYEASKLLEGATAQSTLLYKC